MEVLGGEVDLEVDGFEVTLEPEFTWMFVKVKGLGGAGALREPMDSNSSFPVILTPSIVLAAVETLRIWVAHLWLGDLNSHICYKFG